MKVQIQDQIERYLEVEEILGKEADSIRRNKGALLSTPEQMRQLALEVRRDWKLGEDAIGNVQDVLESKGIKVIATEAPEGFDGVSGIVGGKDYIVVLNSKQDHVERRRFTSMHELAHLLYNDRFSAELTPHQQEKLCNAFASEMLLPSATLRSKFSPGEKISLSELRKLQQIYGISIDAIMHKLYKLGIVSESRYKGYNIRRNTDASLRKYVESSCYREELTDRFETLVYAAAAKNFISTSKAASLLHSSITSVRKHLNVI